jgi:hypothetical protein
VTRKAKVLVSAGSSRKGWAKFGHAKDKPPGIDPSTTSKSNDDIMIDPPESIMAEIDSDAEVGCFSCFRASIS